MLISGTETSVIEEEEATMCPEPPVEGEEISQWKLYLDTIDRLLATGKKLGIS